MSDLRHKVYLTSSLDLELVIDARILFYDSAQFYSICCTVS